MKKKTPRQIAHRIASGGQLSLAIWNASRRFFRLPENATDDQLITHHVFVTEAIAAAVAAGIRADRRQRSKQ